jgi:hypothetical protein
MSSAVPVYDEAYYADYDGQRYERSDQWMGLFRHFADRIVTMVDPVRTLDAGCAIGLLVETLAERGVDAHGFDISDYALGQMPEHVRDRCWVQTLTDPIEGRYDLITCIEVIEHLPAADAHRAVANLCAATDTVLLSSTPIEHEEPTHLNVQPPEYWSALFASQGFFRDTDFEASFISPWAVLYRRRPTELTEVVRSYDRAWWRLRDENQRVRSALLHATDQREALAAVLTDPEWDAVRAGDDQLEALKQVAGRVAAERSSGGGYTVAGLEAELAEERRRRLVMRDELIGAQHRAGEAAGRVAELEAELAAYQTLRRRCEEAEAKYTEVVGSTTWRLAWKVLAPYRRLRGIEGPSS